MNPKTLGGLLVTLIIPQAGAQTLTQHWKMNEASLTFTSGTAPLVNEIAGGSSAAANNAGEANTALWPVANQPGAVFSTNTAVATRTRFQRIQLGNISPATNAFTISLWFKRDSAASSGHDNGSDQEQIISGNQGQTGRWNLNTISFVNDNNFGVGWFHNGGYSPALPLATGLKSNIWYHFAATREMPSGLIKFYLNGLLVGSGTDTAGFTQGANGVLLGRDPGFNATNRGFVGAFDDVRVYNGALSASQVVEVMGDSDGDGLPDAWEIEHFIHEGEDPVADAGNILTREGAADDPDGDESNNLAEYQRNTLPMTADTDSDGLLDGRETGTGTWVSASDTGTNPLKPDTDGDGLLDGQENNTGTYVNATNPGTNPNLADTDGDTYGDYLEISRSSNPVNAGSTPGGSSATPLVELNASGLSEGMLSSWTNTGTIGRSFEADHPVTVETIGGVKGVSFSGAEVLTGPAAPSNLTGSSKRTIEAWIFNPSTSTEEVIAGWGRRDGPNGTNNVFLHGTDPSFGAVGNWGTPDMAWGPNTAAISANVKIGSWTYVVYTYDGGGTNVGNVYSNGVLANTELLGALNTWAVDNTAFARPLPIRVAGYNAADGTISSSGQKGSLVIAKLRIHDRVVPSSDLGFNDTDGDGMLDWYEEFYGLNKLVNDADGDDDLDDLTNLQEQSAGTNPSVSDTDADGLPDGWEVVNFGNQAANPWDDSDHDGSSNLDEYETVRGLMISRDGGGDVVSLTPFLGSSDPNDANSQPDSDDDGLPDGWEFKYLGYLVDGASDDSDGDSYSNQIEFFAGSDPGGIASTPDDVDGDGLDDDWEVSHFGSITAQNGSGDPDEDGSTNIDEFVNNTDPNDDQSQPNTDGDHLPDGYEYIHFGDLTQGDDDDFDSDTFSNLAEYTAGSNPARTASTPNNVNATTHVAVATLGGVDEYTVTHGAWTFVHQICPITGGTSGVTGHGGYIYATTTESSPRVIRINPADGAITELAVRGSGSAATAGWLASNPQGIEVGPEGKLYFSTAFNNNGEGVFRLNTDGSGFEKFIARTGAADTDNNPETPDETWDLNNARDIEWNGSVLYVSARGAFGATGRPVYKFSSTGGFLGALSQSLVAPQGLEIEQDGLLVAGTNAGVDGLVLLDVGGTPPVYPVSRSAAGVLAGLDVIDLNGDTYFITFNTGPLNVGQILRRNFNGTFVTVVNAISAAGADLAVFEPVSGGGYDIWAESHGIDPQTPQGAPTGDADGDGTSNGAEFALDLDPNSGTSRFAISTSGQISTGLTLTWPSAAGISFRIYSSTDLTNWATLEATVIGQPAQTTATWTAPAAGNPPSPARKFYRIEFNP